MGLIVHGVIPDGLKKNVLKRREKLKSELFVFVF